MERPQPRTLLERLIQESDRTFEEVCEDFDRCARASKERRATLSVRQLSRWVAGAVEDARPASRRVAQQLWGHSFKELLGPPHTVQAASKHEFLQEDGTLQAGRQSGTPVSSYLNDAQALVPRVVRALEVTRHASVSELAVLEDLGTVVEHYKRTFRRAPPSELYEEILGVRVHAGSLLADTPATNSDSDLVVAAGWLSNLLALLTHDLHDHAASLVWCADAERRSREAHYPELGGWAAQTRVLMSFYDGQAHEAVTHAQRGQQLAPFGTVAHAKLVAQEMRAWALIGNSDKVSSTRWRAEKAIAKLPPDTPTRGAFSISLADDPPYTATSLLLLGRHKEAVEATRRVIATFYGPGAGEGRREHPSGFARTHLILALALAGLGKLDEAYAAGSVALDAPRLTWPMAALAGKLDRTLLRDFPDTAETCFYHERYVAAMQQNPSVGGHPTHLDAPSS